MTPNRQIFDLLTTSEIVLMLTHDPAWKLPHDATDYRRRMGEALRVIGAACEARQQAVYSTLIDPPKPRVPGPLVEPAHGPIWDDIRAVAAAAMKRGLSEEDAMRLAIGEVEAGRQKLPVCPKCGRRHTKLNLHRTSCYPRKVAENATESRPLPAMAVYVRSHERTHSKPRRRVA